MSIEEIKDDALDTTYINDRNDQGSINTYDDINLETENNMQDRDSIDEEANNSIESIINEKPTKKQPWREILMLSFSSLGAIYGDLGTSPLYVLNSIKYSQNPPNKEDIYGAVSIIFYLFTIIVIFKYVCIVLVFGPYNGNGGQVAIYAKIASYLNIGPKGVSIPGTAEPSDLEILSRTDTTTSSINTVYSRIARVKQNPKVIRSLQFFILGACFLGCSLVISDGLLTPTTSVLSAIGGIQIAVPSFNAILPVSEVILIFLFIIQQFGSNKISFLFAPIIFLWMIGLIICGIYNIAKFHPGIFAALSPYYAIQLLKREGISVFSGSMLCITGTEKLPVQLTLGSFVYPALMLCYLGQGAYIVKNPDAWTNPFFLSLPGGTGSGVYWVMFVLATLATIIASQALILAVFSIVSQLINLDCFPKLKIVHTSSHYSGKVYIPVVNWLLMIGVVCTTAGFKNSNNVTAAYGLGISLDFLVTSSLITICLFYVYNANIIWPILFFIIFVPLEVCLVIANLRKIASGAWFSLMAAILFMGFLSIWRWVRSKKVEQEYSQRIKIGEIFPFYSAKSNAITVDLGANHNVPVEDNIPRYSKDDVNTKFGVEKLEKYEGIGFMYVDSILAASPNTLPQLYGKIIKNFVSIPENFIFVGIRVLSVPTVSEEDRILIAPMKLTNHYKCILRFGFMEDIKIEKELTKRLMNKLPNIDFQQLETNSNYPILHYFENDLIKCHQFQPNTKNKIFNILKKIKYGVRYVTINYLFSPIYSLTQDYGEFLKCDNELEELQNKIFIGGIARV
ncbi:hypothetical protein KGF54_004395 [Candida jiufengensis]|uniref:uncharacterized protein n=1 Tax=Candida jiufengensis TaxID=497108 RepID=UPI002223FCA1|nr:uncharacterized protein KGF54_004395 [Candida jiufengensis]KAI5951321.1 hypothetical protein KGF54_004395 [Candida jiufengensis]